MESDEIVSQFGLGRLHAPDDRDCGYLAMGFLADIPAKRADYKYYKLGPVLNQGRTPQCVGYSSRNFLAASPKMYKKPDPGPTTLYRGAQDNDEWPGNNYDGSSVRGAAKFMQQQGLIKGDYLWAFELDTVLDWLLTGQGPCIFGTNWYTSQFEPDAKGAIRALTGNIAGGHAYLCYGANQKKGTLSFFNSWGPTWGVRGMFTMPLEVVERLIKEDGEVMMASEI